MWATIFSKEVDGNIKGLSQWPILDDILQKANPKILGYNSFENKKTTPPWKPGKNVTPKKKNT